MVVQPCIRKLTLARVWGSTTCESLWLCRSMKPGAITRPRQSISWAMVPRSNVPTATIFWPRRAMSARSRGCPVPSMTVAPVNSQSASTGSAWAAKGSPHSSVHAHSSRGTCGFQQVLKRQIRRVGSLGTGIKGHQAGKMSSTPGRSGPQGQFRRLGQTGGWIPDGGIRFQPSVCAGSGCPVWISRRSIEPGGRVRPVNLFGFFHDERRRNYSPRLGKVFSNFFLDSVKNQW